MNSESSSIPWEYTTLDSIMNSVKEDLHLYDDNNLINEDRLIKIVLKCSEDIGERIHQSKQCRIIVKNYKAPLPFDFWKIENLYGLSCTQSFNLASGILGARQFTFTEEKEGLEAEGLEQIRYMGIIPTDCSKPMHVSSVDPKFFERTENKRIFPLVLSNNVKNKCLPYSACNNWQGQFEVDLDDKEFTFSFKEGEVFLSYLGALVDEDDNILIPLHPLLTPFYEYALKKKILEDLLLNSDADVERKLAYVKEEFRGAKYDAINFILSPKANQFAKMKKKYEMEFYNKWFKAFA